MKATIYPANLFPGRRVKVIQINRLTFKSTKNSEMILVNHGSEEYPDWWVIAQDNKGREACRMSIKNATYMRLEGVEIDIKPPRIPKATRAKSYQSGSVSMVFKM